MVADPYQFYVYIDGIKGAVTEAPYQGWIAGLAMSFSVKTPAGAAAGHPQAQPIVFTKEWDVSTESLEKLALTGSTITSAVFAFLPPSSISKSVAGGSTPPYLHVNLDQVKVTSYTAYTASPDQLNQFNAANLEDIELSYQKIEWQWK